MGRASVLWSARGEKQNVDAVPQFLLGAALQYIISGHPTKRNISPISDPKKKKRDLKPGRQRRVCF